ncbi:MAG: prephenate dehydratase [Bacteroidales bacterium]|jgi:prephenate dehydratase|nr:prephenate dehydratase [Bacteroidales bacterium]MCR5362677.1 prephenate dehydratase [Bacteroidales bacterium]
MAKLRVAIQGQEGCYHEWAARQYFEGQDLEIVCCKSFQSEFEEMAADPSVLGIMAIENTIAGNLLQNHELLRKSQRQVVGEHRLHISHVLCALPGTTLADVIEVNSHPIALAQCEVFLQNTLPNAKVVEMADTAGSAKIIKERNLVGHAAICSEYAANLYGMDILARGIETNKRNFTRFLILQDKFMTPSLVSRSEVNKASLAFCVRHQQGSLSKVLTILSFYDMNLTKIQSMPIIGREWEYRFFVDLTFDDYVEYRKALDAVMPFATDFQILGEYREKTEIRDR